jgi:hypothetical protein
MRGAIASVGERRAAAIGESDVNAVSYAIQSCQLEKPSPVSARTARKNSEVADACSIGVAD